MMCVFATNVRIIATNGNQESTIPELAIAADDEWEDWDEVTAKGFYLSSGRSTDDAMYGCKVQRRMSCGEREYRLYVSNSGWKPVSKSPIKGYKYCIYWGVDKVYCFNM